MSRQGGFFEDWEAQTGTGTETGCISPYFTIREQSLSPTQGVGGTLAKVQLSVGTILVCLSNSSGQDVKHAGSREVSESKWANDTFIEVERNDSESLEYICVGSNIEGIKMALVTVASSAGRHFNNLPRMWRTPDSF